MHYFSVSLLIYLALGSAFILWQARRWWQETDRSAKQLMDETIGHGLAAKALVSVIVLFSLVLDLMLWPRSAWRGWKLAKKQRRWKEHGDFCHCEECDRDE